MRKKLLFCLKKTWTCMAGILLLFFCGFNARSQSIDINGYPDDWCAVLNNADIIKVWVIDANNTNDDSFQKGKDEDWVKDWVWVDGNTNDKGDITNAGAAVIGDYLYFFGDRTAINGDAYIGFWILQDPVKKTYTPVPKGSGFMFSGEHVDGDLLVITNFTNGGGQVTLHIYKWLGGSVVPVATTPDAMVNDIDVVLPTGCSPAWTYSGKLCNAGYYCKGAFIEGKIYIGDKDLCSSSFMLETRNSPAIDASRQDFALGEFNMTPDPPVMVGDADCAPNPELTLAVKDPISGLTYKWYDKETSGTLVHTGVSWTKTFDKTTDYWVTATFMKCESSGTKVTATVWSKPELTLKGTNLLCFEDKTGKIEVSWMGGTTPFKIKLGDGEWKNDDASPYTFEGLAAGTYTIYLEDFHGCADNEKVTLTQPEKLVLTLKGTNLLCFEDKTGKIDASWTGGTAPFDLWLDGALFKSGAVSPENITGLAAGLHKVKVIDKNLCEDTKEVTLSEPPLLTCTAKEDAPSYCDHNNGSSTVTPSGGTPGYTYLWNDPMAQTTQTATGLAPGSYTVKVTDANDCFTTCDVVISMVECPCETAYALGDAATCFTPPFANWGWTNNIVPGDYTWPLWAGASDCKTDNGTLVGRVNVIYDSDGYVKVTFKVNPPYEMDSEHVYAGYTKFPVVNGRETVSPGQYTNMGPFDGSAIYVIAHTVVCGPWEKSAVAPKPESGTYESSLIVYPNPFTQHVTFEFISERDVHAVLDIHNVLGQKISTLLNKTVEQGVLNKADFYPVNQPRGIFYYRLKLGDVVRTGKLFYIR